MQGTRFWILTTLLALVFAAGGLWFGLEYRQGTPEQGAAKQLLALTLPDARGDAHKLADWKGKTLVVNFWATWCPPCREEMPGFSKLQTKHAANGVQFVGIAFDTHEAVSNFSKETPVNYPLLIGDGNSRDLLKTLGNPQSALPFTVVLSADGKLLFSRLGRFNEADLDAKLTAILHR